MTDILLLRKTEVVNLVDILALPNKLVKRRVPLLFLEVTIGTEIKVRTPPSKWRLKFRPTLLQLTSAISNLLVFSVLIRRI